MKSRKKVLPKIESMPELEQALEDIFYKGDGRYGMSGKKGGTVERLGYGQGFGQVKWAYEVGIKVNSKDVQDLMEKLDKKIKRRKNKPSWMGIR